MTQGRRLIEALKRKPHTYMEMLAYGISTAPWKRVMEALRYDELLWKGYRKVGRDPQFNPRTLVTWRVRTIK